MIDGNPKFIDIPHPFSEVDIAKQFQKKSKELSAYLPVLQELIREFSLLKKRKEALENLGGYKVSRIRDWFRCCYLESDQCQLRAIAGKLCCKGYDCDETDTFLCLAICCCSCWMMLCPNIPKTFCPCLDTPCKMCCPCLSNEYRNPSRDEHDFKLIDPRHPIGKEIDQISERISNYKLKLKPLNFKEISDDLLDVYEIKRVCNRIRNFQDPLFVRKFIPLLISDVKKYDEVTKKEGKYSRESEYGFIRSARRFEDNFYDFLNGYNGFCLSFKSTAYEKSIKKYHYALNVIKIAYNGILLDKIKKDPANIVLGYLDICSNPAKKLAVEDLIVHDEEDSKEDNEENVEMYFL